MDHELKIWPEFYKRVADGSKTFEVRDNDREFQCGDTVTLKEWDPKPLPGHKGAKGYVVDSKPLKFKIGFIYNLSSSRVVFSLLPLPANKKGKKSPVP